MTKKEAISILRKWRNIGKKDMTSERLGYIEGGFHKDDSEAFAMAIQTLEEHKTGKWVLAEMGDTNLYECSLCRNRKTHMTPFCDICGAKMESGDNNGTD